MKERFDWKRKRLNPGEAMFIVGFCAAVVLVSGVIVVAEGPSLGAALVWVVASSFLARLALPVWRMRNAQSEGRDDESGQKGP